MATSVVVESDLAYARHDSNSLAPGHVIVVPRRHVADFFDMTAAEHVGVNIGKAAGQNRMHVHVHLIPRYAGDVPDPAGGVRRVLSRL
jgi:diadenosine tetraphosphate (Ap4A) HIT family hydrolase